MDKNTKLRLLVTKKCNRSCPGCCNKGFDLNSLPVVDGFDYDLIMLTGGEPMLFPTQITFIADVIRLVSKAKIVLYTANVTNKMAAGSLLADHLDGITVTIHDEQDVKPFLEFDALCRCLSISKSMRLNIFKESGWDGKGVSNSWKIKSGIEWIDDCPLPPGEEFRRTPELL